MNGNRFDQIATSLAAARTRRGLLELLAALAGAFAFLPARESEAGKGAGGRKGGKRHGHNRTRRRHARRRHNKNTKPKPKTSCTTPCPVCKRCEGEPGGSGVCVPASLGEPCGESGQVCQPDGNCACIPTTCTAQRCGSIADGCGGMLECGPCTDPLAPICDASNTCAACSATTCVDGCCDGATCQVGVRTACGTDGGICVNCDTVDFCNPGPCDGGACPGSPCGCVAGRGCCLFAGNRPLNHGVGCDACCSGACTGPADDPRCAPS